MFRYKIVLISFLIFSISCSLFSQDLKIAKKTVNYLASNCLKGRFPGSSGDKKSITFIEKTVKSYSLSHFDFGYRQNLNLLTEIHPSSLCYAKIGNIELKLERDYLPFSFSAEKSLSSYITVVDNLTDSAQTYNGEWILYYLDTENDKAPAYNDLAELVVKAQFKNAGGLIIISSKNLGLNSEFYPFKYTRSGSQLGIPVLQISKAKFMAFLRTLGYKDENFDHLSDFLNNNKNQILFSAGIEIEKIKSQTTNIVGYIPSADSDEWIVIGAHYDHLGTGGYDSGSRTPEINQVHNGADDNASGVGLVLMLAQYYSLHPASCNLVFVLFGAEEQGLIGSRFFVENLPFASEKIKVMLNFDMVGRIEDSTLSIIGTSTAIEFDSIITTFQHKPLNLKLGGGGFSGSDQASFYSIKIPVLFFNSGMHNDYHTPDDDANKINFAGMLDVALLSVKIIDSLSQPQTKITYKEAEQQQNERHGGNMKVKLGIMPDMTADDGKGVRVDGVTPGGAGNIAGLQKGDLIIAIDNKNIGSIYEYMHVLSEFSKGQLVKIVVIREGNKIELDVQF